MVHGVLIPVCKYCIATKIDWITSINTQWMVDTATAEQLSMGYILGVIKQSS